VHRAGTDFFVFEGDTLIDLGEDEYIGLAPDMGAFEFGDLTGVGQDPGADQSGAGLHLNYPNPFNPQTWIRYELALPAWVELSIHDVLGREIDMLVSAKKDAGAHRVLWDGRNEQGIAVASGIYLCRLRVDGEIIAAHRMTLLR